MNDYFVFPFKFVDILDATDSRYWISSEDNISKMDERHIKRTLTELEKAFFDDFSTIKESERFDFLFFWIRTLETKKENYSLEHLELTSDLLIGSLERIIKLINQEAKKEGLNLGGIEDLRVCFKMNLFLMFFFLQNTRIKRNKNSLKDEINEAAQIQTSKNEKKKNKTTKNKRDMTNEMVDLLVKKQRQCIMILQDSLDVDFKFLWNKRSIDDELFKYYVETCLVMLESKILLKENEVKACIFEILEFVLAEFPEAQKNVQIKLVNLIYEDENIVAPIADFIIKGYKSEKGNMSKLSTETLMMLVIYVVEKTNVNNESQAVKNCKDFFSIVSEAIPKMFYNNLSSFIVLYDSEAYLLRNALNEIIANIIKKVLTISEEEDINNQENHILMKKKLLDKLIPRVYDKHAYCRSHVLGILSNLCEANTVPRDYLFEILKKACDRMKDVSAHVRKKAIQLIIITMQYYYVIFVQSQKQIEIKKFLGKERLDKDLNNNKLEENEIKNGLLELEDSLKQIEDPLSPQIAEIQADIKSLKRKLDQCLNMRKYLQEYKEILLAIEDICPNLEILLGSKNIGDVLETIKLLTFLYKQNIESSRIGVKKMLVLIWSKDKLIKEEVLKAYFQLFFDPKEYDSLQISSNIIALLNESNLTEATSLEELLSFMIDWNNQIEEKDKEKKRDLYQISPNVYKNLWETFNKGLNEPPLSNKKEMRAALQILRICFSKNKEALVQKFEGFINILSSFQKRRCIDWIIVKEFALILEKSAENHPKLTRALVKILTDSHGTADTEWFCSAEQIINMIFSFKTDPENLSKVILLKCTGFLYEKKGAEPQTNQINSTENNQNFTNAKITPEKLTQTQLGFETLIPAEKETNEMINEDEDKEKDNEKGLEFEMRLAQLLFVVGHIAIKYLIYIDNYENELKKLKNEAETKYQANQKDNNTEDLEKIHGGLEAEYEKKIEMLHQISEHHLFQKNLLGSYIPIIKKICQDILNGLRVDVNPILDRAVLMTLCKFMCVSGEFCKENLDMLFKLMNSNIDPTIKNNIIISLGDLMHRYPNIIEPFTNNIYQNLRDKDSTVRKTTLLVITHLILNDMLKPKGEICDVALLLDDKEIKIQNLVKLFFHELHKKDPKRIYNLLPEAIGRMSKLYENEEKENFDENVFQNFARNIMPYLEKDKYSESLVEKLCTRFKNTKNEKEWRNTAFCMSLLPYNEKELRKLLEFFENYREKLNDPFIMDCFRAILTKLKKNLKSENKNMLDEWESKLNNFMNETNEEKRKFIDKSKRNKKFQSEEIINEEEKNADVNKENHEKSLQNNDAKPKKIQKKLRNKKKSHDFIEDDDEEDENSEEFDENLMELEEDNEANSRNISNTRLRPKRNTNRKNYFLEIEEESEPNEEIEEEEYENEA